jgi:hypothetical protein
MIYYDVQWGEEMNEVEHLWAGDAVLRASLWLQVHRSDFPGTFLLGPDFITFM